MLSPTGKEASYSSRRLAVAPIIMVACNVNGSVPGTELADPPFGCAGDGSEGQRYSQEAPPQSRPAMTPRIIPKRSSEETPSETPKETPKGAPKENPKDSLAPEDAIRSPHYETLASVELWMFPLCYI